MGEGTTDVTVSLVFSAPSTTVGGSGEAKVATFSFMGLTLTGTGISWDSIVTSVAGGATFSVDFGDAREPREQNRTQVSGEVPKFLPRRWHKAPIIYPSITVQLMEDPDFLFEAAKIPFSKYQLRPGKFPINHPLHPIRKTEPRSLDETVAQ